MPKRTRQKTRQNYDVQPFPRRPRKRRKTKAKVTAKPRGTSIKRAKPRTDAVRLTALEKTVASHGKRLDKVEKSVAIVTRAMKGYRK